MIQTMRQIVERIVRTFRRVDGQRDRIEAAPVDPLSLAGTQHYAAKWRYGIEWWSVRQRYGELLGRQRERVRWLVVDTLPVGRTELRRGPGRIAEIRIARIEELNRERHIGRLPRHAIPLHASDELRNIWLRAISHVC